MRKLLRDAKAGLGTFSTSLIFGAIGMSLLIAVAVLMAVTHSFNRQSVSREAETVVSALANELSKVESLAIDYAWWDEAIEHLVIVSDSDWADSNIGSWMTEAHHVDFTAVVSADDRVTMAFRDGFLMDPAVEPVAADSFASVIREARAAATAEAPGTASTVLALGSERRPVIVAAATFGSDDLAETPWTFEGQPVLLIAKAFDEALIASLGKAVAVEGLRLEPPSAPATWASLDLVDEGGEVLGRMSWDPQLPGTEFIAGLAPVFIASFMALFGLSALVIVRTNNLSAANVRLSREIERREILEASLIEAKEAAEVASRAKSEFLANMSHELRTPLNAIIGFSDMLQHSELFRLTPQKCKSYAGDIHASGHLLLDIISDILDLAKIDAGAVEPQDTEVDLRVLTPQVTRLVEGRAAKGRVTLETKLAPELPRLVADDRLVKQMVINLLTNAVKFTPEGGRVTLEGTLEDGSVVVRVRDTGIGIPADKIPVVMEPFGQVDNALSRKHGGTGLGLPISKRFADMHGAAFELESTVGEGTVVTVRFPPERSLIVDEASVPAAA